MSNEIQTADEILKQIEAVAAVEKEVPPGYQRIVMSTKGKYGAPPVLHLRNFSIEEALELGSIAQEEIPIKITSLMQRIILEPDVDIGSFYDQEVAELSIHFYRNFYSHVLKEQTYELKEADKQWMLKEVYKGKATAEYQNWLRGVENGQIPLKYDIDLNSVGYYRVPDGEVKTKIKYSNGNFNCIFQYPRFGDTALLQKAVQEKFRTQDRQFGPLYEIWKRKQEAEARYRRGENVAIDAIPYLDPDDTKAIREYELEKTTYIISQMKGLYLCEIMGEDLSDKPLSERVEIAKDPRIDYSTYQTVQDTFGKLKIGPYPKIQITNPVSNLQQEIDHPFRTLDLLAAIKNYRSDNANIELV